MISYPYIRAWGEQLGSYESYTNCEVELAERQGAPHTAVFQRDHEWVLVDQISDAARKQLDEHLVERGWTVPTHTTHAQVIAELRRKAEHWRENLEANLAHARREGYDTASCTSQLSVLDELDALLEEAP